jgi:hypothetical protein
MEDFVVWLDALLASAFPCLYMSYNLSIPDWLQLNLANIISNRGSID